MTDYLEVAIELFQNWYDDLPTQKATGSAPRGTIAAALVVLERLQGDYDLEIAVHRAPGGSQVRGVSGTAVSRILGEFGETRRFLREGGRTNRGALGAVAKLLDSLSAADLDSLDPNVRNSILVRLQQELVEKVREFHSRQRLSIVYDPAMSTRQSIAVLLDVARDQGREGPVAQYLVGAKLQVRYPDLMIRNETFSTADTQLGESGDFTVGDTAFHVTVAPMGAIFDKCRANLDQGLRAYLLVPERVLLGARQNADGLVAGRVGVESVESFVAQNVDELAGFSIQGAQLEFGKLLSTYNMRVDAIEFDKSMLVEIPQNLQ